jgi:hypothetical protein
LIMDQVARAEARIPLLLGQKIAIDPGDRRIVP